MHRTATLLFFASLLFSSSTSFAQAGQWTWMKGDTQWFNIVPEWGTLGVPDAANKPPGLYEGAQWTDFDGNFWFLGGLNFSEYNTLWRYNPVTNEWTWMGGSMFAQDLGSYGTQGVASPTNFPPSRAWGAATWTDLNGNLWLFGGMGNAGFTYGELNDLWKYDITNNEWTWMKGSNFANGNEVYGTQGVPNNLNTPGPRHETDATWVDDSNNLWLFGGYDGNQFNDLWRYSISSNEWTWMKGSNINDQPGHYGTQGVENPLNVPGARCAYVSWRDHSGYFWLFGGGFFTAAGGVNNMNDVWRYNPQTNNWAWMTGDTTANTSAVLDATCSSQIANSPAGRLESRACWQDSCDNFYVFGGSVDNFFGNRFNDFWRFNPGSLEWTLISGSINYNQPAHYGTQGVAAPGNHPDSRAGSLSWSDKDGNLWLFGGSLDFNTPLNDLWKFTPDPDCGIYYNACQVVSSIHFFASDTDVCEKFCIDFFDSSANNPTSWLWLFPGGSPSSSTLQNPVGICYNVSGVYDVTLITTSASGTDSLVLNDYITIYPNPQAPTITQNGNLLTSSPATTYQWQLNNIDIPGATDQSYTVAQSGFYSVLITNEFGCGAIASADVSLTGMESVHASFELAVYPNPSPGNFYVEARGIPASEIEVQVLDLTGREIVSEVSDISSLRKNIYINHPQSGSYLLEIKTRNEQIWKKISVLF